MATIKQAQAEAERMRRQNEYLKRELEEARRLKAQAATYGNKKLKVKSDVKKLDSFKEQDVILLVNQYSDYFDDLFTYAAPDVRPMYKSQYELAIEMIKFHLEADFFTRTGFKWKLNGISVGIKAPKLVNGVKSYDAMDSITLEFVTDAEEVYPVDATADGIVIDNHIPLFRTMKIRRFMLQNVLR